MTSSSEDKEPTTTGSITTRINKFMDEQRLERLKQCQEIDAVLKNCLQRRKEMLSTKKTTTIPEWDINQTVPGTRMMRYFGWHQETPVSDSNATSFSSILHSTTTDKNSNEQQARSKVNVSQQSSSNNKNKKKKVSNTVTIPSCAKETHALWACRSVCLGCAPHLRNLKDCFQLVPPDVLENPTTAYEPNNTASTNVIPCKESQQELGKCVIQNAKELQQRLDAAAGE